MMNQGHEGGYLVVSMIAVGDIECRCGRCGWTGMAKQLDPVKACELKPGDPSPAGRCPKCFDLAYPDREEDREAANAGRLHQMLAALVALQERLDKGKPVNAEALQATIEGAKSVLKAVKGRKRRASAERCSDAKDEDGVSTTENGVAVTA